MNRTASRVTALCCVSSLLLASSPALSEGSEGESSTEMRALVEDYAHAVEANHLELAMTYVHGESPHRQGLAKELGDQLSSYFERAEILSFGPAQEQEDSVTAPVVQRLVRVFGMKITRSKRDSVFVFRKQLGDWRIWNVQPQDA
jgi:hypothetical protein